MRAARKLQALKEEEQRRRAAATQSEGSPEDRDEEEEDDTDDAPAPALNLFALVRGLAHFALGVSCREANMSKLNAGASGDNSEEEEEEPPEEPEAELAPATPPPKSSNKKKKKKKGKGKAAVGHGSDDEKRGKVKEDSEDEIEAAVMEINATFGELAPVERPSASTSKVTKKALLSIEPRHLDADAELRRFFGSKIMDAEIKAKRYVKKGPAVPGYAGVRTVLTTPRDTWPRMEARVGIGMEMLQSPSRPGDADVHPGVFAFTYSSTYLEIQAMFLKCVNSHDPDTIANLLHAYPFHVDALLQMSEVARLQQPNPDLAKAAEYVERALHVYERSFHSMFGLASGSCQLPYEYRENRAFHLALGRHVNFVGRRGCWRTCLEVSKLLLSIDPEEDPLGAMLGLDFYAVKAREFEWFQRLWREWGGHGIEGSDGAAADVEIVGMPNLEFGIALVEWELENKETNLAAGGTRRKSSELLRRAILNYPVAVVLLLDKAATTDPYITNSPVFTDVGNPVETDSEKAVDILIRLFVERSHPLWKEPEVLAWLRQVAGEVANLGLHDAAVKNGLENRRTAYTEGLPLNVSRHIYVSEYSNLMPFLPASATRRGMNAFDPMPPLPRPPERSSGGASVGETGGGIMHYASWLMGSLRAAIGLDAAGGAGEEAGDDDGEFEEEDTGED
ncbi:Transcription factor 25 [Irineochytrium annulatum]|nr:Transcription factor 25 [Irineochytrium annulatum]